MNKIKKLYKQYNDSYSELLKLFGIDSAWEPLELHKKAKWFEEEDGGYLTFFEDDSEYGWEYAKKCGDDIDGYTLFYVQDNGDKFYALFKTKNIIKT